MPFVTILDDKGISVTTNGQTISTNWGGIRQVLTEDGAIELVLHPLGIIVLEEEDFRDPAERETWLRTIEERRAIAAETGSTLQTD